MTKTSKKGFTLVELVIVIAVIAILAAVLIPTFSSVVKKAQYTSDIQLVKNLNLALEADDGKTHATMTEALDAAKEYGYDVAKINSKGTDSEILWDSVNDVFCYLQEDGSIEYIPDSVDKGLEEGDYRLWKISNKVDTVYSTYLYNYSGTSVETSKGLDTGDCAVTSVKYTNSGSEQTVTLRTTGDQCVLTILAPNDDVNYYGFAKTINVGAVASSSLHVYGAVNELAVNDATSHVEIEESGVIFNVSALTTGATITNNGYIAKKDASITTGITGTAVGGDYLIEDLEDLENFRDIVNSGANDFSGITVKLTANIELNDGWTPIGKGGRKGTSAVPFSGTFDGNNKTISNLNNKGYDPSTSETYDDIYGGQSSKAYAYGLFGLTKNATIKNLTLSNVDIDSSRTEMAGDSVAALIGYSIDSLTLSNITVSGKIKAEDAVGGVVGRAYKVGSSSVTVSIEGCTNNCEIIGTVEKCAGIIGYTSVGEAADSLITINNCKNNGNISSQYAAGIVVFGTYFASYNGQSVTNCTNGSNVTITRTHNTTQDTELVAFATVK